MATPTWIVILPPLLVLLSVLTTRRMILSFLIGIVSSALIVTGGALQPAISLILKRFGESSGLDKIYSWQALWTNWNLSIFIFLISLGVLITLLQRSGSTQAFLQLAQKRVKSKKSAEVTSLLLSLAFFIDDYFAALTVGSVMRPLAAAYRVSSVKLAFLVTALASPITILSPLSSWVGEIIAQLRQVGVAKTADAVIAVDPFYAFIQSIPFIFYALFMIFSAWYIVLRKISYGPMAIYEKQENHNEHSVSKEETQSISIFYFAFPLLLLIGFIFTTLLATGGYSLFGGTSTLLEALKNGSIQQAFLVSGIGTLLISIPFFWLYGRIAFQEIGPSLCQGAWLMIPSIIMLVHAWTLGVILKTDLQTGTYFASLFCSVICINFLPLASFVTAALIASMIGSAWATMGLMFPIIIPLLKVLLHLPAGAALEAVPLALPAIGATLSGCVIGTHLSFIADNPIMAATSSGAPHFELMKAMTWYVVPVGIATAAAYWILGITLPLWGLGHSFIAALILGLIVLVLLFEIAQRLFGKK